MEKEDRSQRPQPRHEGDLELQSTDQALPNMQLVQHVYREITGKTEKIDKVYDRAIRVGVDDFEQLNARVGQLCQQYNIAEATSSVTVYHKEDQRETFSSFERFRLYNRSTLSPVREIVFEWKFLVVLPQTKKPQSYTVEVRVRSLVAMETPSDLPDELFFMLAVSTARIEVEFVDYVVARTVVDALDEWVRGLPAGRKRPVVEFFVKRSTLTRDSLRLVLLAAACFAVFRMADVFLPTGTEDLRLLSRFLLGGAMVLVFANYLGGRLGSVVVQSARLLRPISYVKLNRGDEAAIEKAETAARLAWIRSLVATVLTFAISLTASLIAGALGGGE